MLLLAHTEELSSHHRRQPRVAAATRKRLLLVRGSDDDDDNDIFKRRYRVSPAISRDLRNRGVLKKEKRCSVHRSTFLYLKLRGSPTRTAPPLRLLENLARLRLDLVGRSKPGPRPKVREPRNYTSADETAAAVSSASTVAVAVVEATRKQEEEEEEARDREENKAVVWECGKCRGPLLQ